MGIDLSEKPHYKYVLKEEPADKERIGENTAVDPVINVQIDKPVAARKSNPEVEIEEPDIIEPPSHEGSENEGSSFEEYKDGLEKGIYYKTKDVAIKLGMSEQTIRNYCQVFDEYLNIIKTPSGHRLFSAIDIERLKGIIQIKNEKGISLEQTYDLLTNESDPDTLLLPEKRLEFFMKMIEESVEEAVMAGISKGMNLIAENQTLQIEETNGMLEQMKSEIEKKDAMIEELIRQNKEYLEKVENLENSTQDYLNEISQKNEKNHQELLNNMQELNKKKKFFWQR